MTIIFVVGDNGSFTWEATIKRFGSTHKLTNGGSQLQLLRKLLRINKRRIVGSSIVPIWNSNSGTIVLDDKTNEDLTAGTLKGDAGKIIDLWGERIIFGFGVVGKKLVKGAKIYSVSVAEWQCSDFIAENPDAIFDGYNTTNIACKKLLDNKRDGNGLLCSIELLKNNRINILNKDVANTFNYTVFFGLNKHPNKNLNRISLGCFLMDLEGDQLPTDFISHWVAITSSKDIVTSKNIIAAIPKIIFILRYKSSKALVLMEIPCKKSLSDPWVAPAGDSIVKSYGQVGLLSKSFSNETTNLIKKFPGWNGGKEVIFYGRKYNDNGNVKSNYFWICPLLKISVHGFEPELVKNCARLQVDRLNDFYKNRTTFPPDVGAILAKYNKDKKILMLAEDSKPNIL